MHRTALLALLCLATRTAGAQTPRIVENPRPTWTAAQTLRLGATPVLVIGEKPDAKYQFGRIVGAGRLRDGRIVVADYASATIRFFDSTGTFLKSVGGKGEGPGEFRSLELFAVTPGDTLIAGTSQGELSIFTGTGQYLRRIGTMNTQGPPPPPPSRGSSATPQAAPPRTPSFTSVAILNGSGTRVVMPLVGATARSGGARWLDSLPLSIIDSKNATIRQLGMHPSGFYVMEGERPRSVWLGAISIFATDGQHFYAGHGSDYAIRVYDARGNLQQIVRRAWTPTNITKKDIDTFIDEWIRLIPSPSRTAAEDETRRADLRKAPFATTVPAFSQFIGDAAGRLWVREAHLADTPGDASFRAMPLVPSKWSVFDHAGTWLGDVTMPARFSPRTIGADYVLGVARDDDDVPTIAVYRLGTGKP